MTVIKIIDPDSRANYFYSLMIWVYRQFEEFENEYCTEADIKLSVKAFLEKR